LRSLGVDNVFGFPFFDFSRALASSAWATNGKMEKQAAEEDNRNKQWNSIESNFASTSPLSMNSWNREVSAEQRGTTPPKA